VAIDSNVGNSEGSRSIAVTPAASVGVQPGHGVPVRAPVGEGEDHPVSESLAHGSEVISVTTGPEVVLGTVLLKGGVDASEVGAVRDELLLDGEPLAGVDSVAGIWSHGFVPGVVDVGAATTSVAVPDWSPWARVALVWSDVHGVFVGLHEVILPTPDSTNLIGITVVVATGRRVRLSTAIIAWHGDSVEGCVARASNTAEVDIVSEGPSKQLDLRVGVGIPSRVDSVVSHVSSASVWKMK